MITAFEDTLVGMEKLDGWLPSCRFDISCRLSLHHIPKIGERLLGDDCEEKKLQLVQQTESLFARSWQQSIVGKALKKVGGVCVVLFPGTWQVCTDASPTSLMWLEITLG